jgi:hypothetical protein
MRNGTDMVPTLFAPRFVHSGRLFKAEPRGGYCGCCGCGCGCGGGGGGGGCGGCSGYHGDGDSDRPAKEKPCAASGARQARKKKGQR